MPYSPVYSSQFVVYTPSTPNFLYDVPANYTAVVRQISVAQDIGGWIAVLQIRNSNIAPWCNVWLANQQGDINYVDFQGRFVVPGGGSLQLYLTTLGSDTFGYVGGYLIQNTVS